MSCLGSRGSCAGLNLAASGYAIQLLSKALAASHVHRVPCPVREAEGGAQHTVEGGGCTSGAEASGCQGGVSGLAGVGAVLRGRGDSAGNDRKRAYQPDGLIGPDWSSGGGAGSGGDPGTGRAGALESGEVGRRMASQAAGGNPESTRKGAGPGADTGRVPLG